MTLEQLRIFIAVAEREHLTRAAEAIGLTPSAVSAAVKALETHYGVELFHRIGRRIELTAEGRAFLPEAKAVLARLRSAESALGDLGGLAHGALTVHASQTVASYWLPPLLMAFHERYPGIALSMVIGNTMTVARAMLDGGADIGFVEGPLDEPALSVTEVAKDRLAVVVGPRHAWAGGQDLSMAQLVEETGWVMREPGSGTRAAFEDALRAAGQDPRALRVVLELPSNEAVLSAVRGGICAAAISESAAATALREGSLLRAYATLPTRAFSVLRHKERRQSRAAAMLEKLARENGR